MFASPTTQDSAASRTPLHSLDGLARRTHSELDALYRAAVVSTTMRAADGDLVGRMLAVRGMPALLARGLRRWAASPGFPWEGKSFISDSEHHGIGHNRVFVRGVLGHQSLFPFETSFGPSAIDGRPTLILNYDLDANPRYIRRIHDEIREVSPGLFLGPAMWKRTKDHLLVLWFGLDARAR